MDYEHGRLTEVRNDLSNDGPYSTVGAETPHSFSTLCVTFVSFLITVKYVQPVASSSSSTHFRRCGPLWTASTILLPF